MYFYPSLIQHQKQINFQNSSNYYISTQNLNCLYHQIENSTKIIQELKKQNSKLKQQLKQMQQSYHRNQEIIREQPKKENKYYKKIRNQNGEMLQRSYECPFDQCFKVYGSTLALDLHIKKKHDGRTKKQREAYAKMIILAQMKGEPIPQINFNFPPGYLEKFRQKFEKKQKLQKQLQKD